jgi:hypothetical protein
VARIGQEETRLGHETLVILVANLATITHDARNPKTRITGVIECSELNDGCLRSHREGLATYGNGTLSDAARRAAYVNRHLPHT